MDVCDPAMLVVKQEPPDPDSPSQTRISLINSGLDEKSQALTKTFSALCDLLHEYRAELELTRENQEKEDRYPKLVHEINTLKTKISSRDTEIERLQRLSDEHVIKFNTKDREKDAEIERLEEKLKFCNNKAKAAMQRLSNAHVVNAGKLVRELSVKDAMVKEANSKIEKMENKFRALGASYLVETENEESSTPVPERLRFVTSPSLEVTSPGLVTSAGSGKLAAAVTDAAEPSKSKNEPLDVLTPVPTTSGVQEPLSSPLPPSPPFPPSPEISPPELTGVLCIKEEVDSEPDGSDPLSALLAEPQQVQDSEAVEAHAGSVLAMKDTACSDADCSEPAPKRTKWEPVKAAEGAERLVPDSVVRTPGKRTSKLDIKLAKLMSLSPSSALAASRPQPVTSSDSGITSQILPMPSPAVDPKSNTANSKFRPILPRAVPRLDQTAALPASLPLSGYAPQPHVPRTVALTPLIIQPAAMEQSGSQSQPGSRTLPGGVFVLQQPDGQKVILDDNTLKKVRGERGKSDALTLATKQLAMYQNHENHYDKAPSRATLYRWRKRLGFYDNKIPRKRETCRHCGMLPASDPNHTSYRGWRYCPIANAGTSIKEWKEMKRQAYLRKKHGVPLHGLQVVEEEVVEEEVVEEEEDEEEEEEEEATTSSQKEIIDEHVVKIEVDSD